MLKKIFVFESDNKETLNSINNNVLNLLSNDNESIKCRNYDEISDAFASEYTDDIVNSVFENERNDYNCLSSGIPLNDLKNHISDNIRKDRYYETEITDAVLDELCQLDILISESDGKEKFNKMYEIKKDELGDSFLIFK